MLVAFITVLSASSSASVEGASTGSFTGDFVIDSGLPASPGGAVAPALADARPGALPEVDAAPGSASARGGRRRTRNIRPRLDHRPDVIDVGVLDGSPTDLDTNDIAVLRRRGGTWSSATPSRSSSWTRVRSAAGRPHLDDDDQTGHFLVGIAASEANVAHQLDSQVIVELAPGVSADTAGEAIEPVVDRYPGADGSR